MVGRPCCSFFVLMCLMACVVFCDEEKTSSLTFVIDETISMQSDIRSVKKSVDKIFDSVINSPNSPIGIFNIVTFDENDSYLRTKTDNREQFKNALNLIRPNGGGDCPEITFDGMERGIKETKKDSYVLVFTDAPPKDSDLYEKVKNLALDLNIKIIFLLTMSDCLIDDKKNVEPFNKLAEATGGQVFELRKKNLQKILEYIKGLVETRKSELVKEKFPPGYGHEYNYTVDSATHNVTLVVTGDVPQVEVKNSSLTNVVNKTVVNDKENTIVIDLRIIKPGELSLKLGSKNETTLTLLGTTDVNYGYGFSAIEPTSLNGTTNRPIPDHKSYVLIKVNSDGENINITKIQTLHINGSVIMEYPMRIVNLTEQLYISEPINCPNDTFKLKIIGVKITTNELITRFSDPVEVQKVVDSLDEKAPLVDIMEIPNHELNYGDSLQLQCVVSGYPTPNITWEDESGSLLKNTILPKKLPYDYISVLKVDRLMGNSTFSCKASNKLGSEVKSFKVHIKPFFKAVNISKDKVLEYGKEDILYCKVDAYPPANIIWRLNGKEIENDEDINVSSDRSSLNIKKVKSKFAGDLTCEVNNTLITKIYTMKISIPGSEPLVRIIGESKIELNYGERLQLQCVVTGKPIPNITWEDVSGSSLNSAALSTKNDDYISTLTIDRVTQNNTFSCKASNDLGSKVQSVMVSLNPFIEAVDISKDKDIEYNKKDVLYCKVNANPPANITWQLNGTEIEKDEDIRESSDGSRLIIEHMKPKFSGNFTCEVKNIFFTKVYSIKVSIVGLAGPKINKDITEMVIPIFQNDNIECRILEGNPNPTIRWFFKYDTDETFKEIEGHNEIYHIRNATADRAGTYKCEAKNEIDSDTHTVQLFIEQPVTIDVPKETTINVMVGKNLLLNCPMRGYPTPEIKWRYTSYDKRDKDIYGDSTLQISTIQLSETGYYTCYAETNKGSLVSLTYTVNVFAPPSIENTTGKNLNAVVGDRGLKVPCSVTGFPKPRITWFMNDKALAIDSEWYRKDEHESLLIINIDTFHSGTYFCVAENDFGKDQAKFVVTVDKYPIFENIKNSHPVYIEGSKEIECPLKHGPTDLVRWYQGKELKQTEALIKISLKNCKKYLCRVSNFDRSESSKIHCKVGRKPKFSDLNINLGPRNFNADDRTLSCPANGSPPPKTIWKFNGVELKNAKGKFSFTYEPVVSSIGQYECIAENELGKNKRIFNVVGTDCVLYIEKDFDRYHPLIIISNNKKNKEILNGYILHKDTNANFYCPEGFNMFRDTKIEGTCVGNKTFRIHEKIIEYPELRCEKEFTPATIKTKKYCGINTEIIKIGININENFEEVYKICFEKELKIPLYVVYNMAKFRAGVQSKNEPTWNNNDLINYNIEEMFDCKQQIINTANTFEFTTDDNCCFALRQLVNEKDLQPGFGLITTYSYLNVIPHWSTCSMENWNTIENKIRQHVIWCEEPCLKIATGISQSLQIPVGDSNVTLHLKDKSDSKIIVPVFLWKIIIDLEKKTSVAIVQLNIPNSLKQYIPKALLSPCKDICKKINWMKSIDTTDERKGLIFCCATREFEKSFNYQSRFSRGKFLNLLIDLN